MFGAPSTSILRVGSHPAELFNFNWPRARSRFRNRSGTMTRHHQFENNRPRVWSGAATTRGIRYRYHTFSLSLSLSLSLYRTYTLGKFCLSPDRAYVLAGSRRECLSSSFFEVEHVFSPSGISFAGDFGNSLLLISRDVTQIAIFPQFQGYLNVSQAK